MMYQRMAILCSHSEYRPHPGGDNAVDNPEKYCGDKNEHQHHGSGEEGLLAGGPGNFAYFLTYFTDEFRGASLRHFALLLLAIIPAAWLPVWLLAWPRIWPRACSLWPWLPSWLLLLRVLPWLLSLHLQRRREQLPSS